MVGVVAIDPGPVESAIVYWRADPPTVLQHRILLNDEMLKSVRASYLLESFTYAIETIMSSRGMPVGAATFSTVLFTGRVIEAIEGRVTPVRVRRVTRDEVKLHVCGRMQARDSNIRQALIDRYGEPGRKSKPGILHGLKADEWAALAVAVTVADSMEGTDGSRSRAGCAESVGRSDG